MKIAVLGSGGHSRTILELLVEEEHRTIDVFDNSFDRTIDQHVLGFSLVGTLESFISRHHKRYEVAYLAIGDNMKRRELHQQLKVLGIRMPMLISSKSKVGNRVKIGDASVVGHGAYVGPECNIGDRVIINTMSIVEHECTIESGCHVGPGSVLCGRCHVMEDTLIGAGTTVLPGISIAKEVVVGAGSLVCKDLKRVGGLYYGNPARERL